MIRFSSYNQQVEHHGRKPHIVWLTRYDGTERCLGVASYTTYRKWCAELDNMKGDKRFFECDSLNQLRTQVRAAYNHFT